MSHCVKEFPPLDLALQARIRDRILADQAPSLPSLLYDTHDKSKIYNLERRSSAFRLFSDHELFKDCDALVDLLSEHDPSFTYTLRHNDVTHIHYEKDDFFEAHSDYLSLTSNHVQEFTLIMCLDATCGGKGGETRFTLNPFCSMSSSASVTPLHMVLFRKDITHEGVILKEGTKDIITLNLWGMPSSSPKTLVISFPPEEEQTFYAIPWSLVERFPHCFFIGWAAFTDKKDDEQVLLDYRCTVASYEEMKIVVGILHGTHLEMDTYMLHAELVKFFGFVNADLLLEIPRSVPMDHPKETSLSLASSKDPTRSLKLVFADSSASLAVLNKRIKEEGLNALTFSMAFYEGNSDEVDDYGGEEPDLVDLDGSTMTFMAGEFGESRQLLSYSFPAHHGGKELNVEELILSCGTEETKNVMLFDEYDFEPHLRELSGVNEPACVDEPACVNDTEKETLKIFGRTETDHHGNTRKVPHACRHTETLSLRYSESNSFLKFGLVCGPLSSEPSLEEACTRAFVENDHFDFKLPFAKYRVFSRDSTATSPDPSLPYLVDPETNKIYLDRRRQKALKEALDDYEVMDGIIKALPSLALRFPQRRINESFGLCNETLYVNFSLVFVYGVMCFE